jgi:hypothetical protein
METVVYKEDESLQEIELLRRRRGKKLKWKFIVSGNWRD